MSSSFIACINSIPNVMWGMLLIWVNWFRVFFLGFWFSVIAGARLQLVHLHIILVWLLTHSLLFLVKSLSCFNFFPCFGSVSLPLLVCFKYYSAIQFCLSTPVSIDRGLIMHSRLSLYYVLLCFPVALF